ncbi:MAG: hypothetical protein LBN02_08435 [Oscillospiraceae bacterium]|jgi:D-alanyl-D-alanine carboxypeptidase|nr:hypothetical protein [Oscillospiraceae bacterium]
MKISKLICAVIAAVTLFGVAPRAVAAPYMLGVFADPKAPSMLIGEVTTGDLLYAVGDDTAYNPVGLVKVMTLLLAAEAVERGAVVTRESKVSVTLTALNATPSGGTNTGLVLGETLRFYDLLVLGFVGGGADACNVIAERVAGDIGAFVELMNTRAVELGCVSTLFENPHGEAADMQYTTAHDLFRITAEASRHSLFREVAGAVTATIPATAHNAQRVYTTHNYMINPSTVRHYYKYAVAGRSSQSSIHGYSTVEYAVRDGMGLVTVILGAKAVPAEDGGTDMLSISEARRMFEWAYGQFAWREVLTETIASGAANVRYGAGADTINLRPAETVRLLLPKATPDVDIMRFVRIYTEENGGRGLAAPIRAGTEVGEVRIMIGDREYARVKLVTDTSVTKDYAAELRDNISTAMRKPWMIALLIFILLLIVAYCAFAVSYNRRSRAKQIQEREKRRKLAEQRRRNESAAGAREFEENDDDGN